MRLMQSLDSNRVSCIAFEMDNMTKTNYAEKQNNDQYSLEEYVDDESEVEEAVDIDIIVGMDKVVVRTPQRIVRQVQRELSLINLC